MPHIRFIHREIHIPQKVHHPVYRGNDYLCKGFAVWYSHLHRNAGGGSVIEYQCGLQRIEDYGILLVVIVPVVPLPWTWFFIMVDKAPHLDGEYAAFGKITEGMAEADKIVSAERDWNDCPRVPQVIKSIRVMEE